MDIPSDKKIFQPCPDLPSPGRVTYSQSGKAKKSFHKNPMNVNLNCLKLLRVLIIVKLYIPIGLI